MKKEGDRKRERAKFSRVKTLLGVQESTKKNDALKAGEYGSLQPLLPSFRLVVER